MGLIKTRGHDRLQDSLLMWTELCKNKILAKVPLILFLNKCDLLLKKLEAGSKSRMSLGFKSISAEGSPQHLNNRSQAEEICSIIQRPTEHLPCCFTMYDAPLLWARWNSSLIPAFSQTSRPSLSTSRSNSHSPPETSSSTSPI